MEFIYLSIYLHGVLQVVRLRLSIVSPLPQRLALLLYLHTDATRIRAHGVVHVVRPRVAEWFIRRELPVTVEVVVPETKGWLVVGALP